MQSAARIPSDSCTFHFQWKSRARESYVPHQVLIFRERKISYKSRSLFSSLKTPCQYKFEGAGEGEKPSAGSTSWLPVVYRKSDGVWQYFWDGNCLRLVCVDGRPSGVSLRRDEGFNRLLRIFSSAVRNFFIPREVPGNYMDYLKWKFLHRVFSSALQVLATQAMFRAIGIGYSRSLPSAAAVNWVFKDGLGRLSRCIYSACLASAFDTNLKRVRFSASVLFSLGVGVELLTPTFPRYFLLLASVANIAKQMSLACYLSTVSAIHRCFAISDNLGEVSAKAQIQTVCFDFLGLMVAALLNKLVKNNQRLVAGLPLVYPIFTAVDLFGIYQGLKHVHLQTLTKDRLLIILNTWVQSGYVPSPAEVSKEEGINFPWSKRRELWPIRIGCLNHKYQIPKLSAMTLQYLSSKDFYFISVEIVSEGLPRAGQQGLLLCLLEGAGSAEIIVGLLQACYIRKALLLSPSWLKNIFEVHEPSHSVLREWFKLIEDSKRCAQDDLDKLNEQMLGLGWTVKNILLSTQEQAGCGYVHG